MKYLLQSLQYEYNDETNYLPEGGSGKPELIFSDKAAAEKKRDELDYEEMKDTCLNLYCYNLSELVRYSRDNNSAYIKLKSMGVLDEKSDSDYTTIDPNLSFEKYLELKKVLDLSFYTVTEVKEA